MIENQTDALDPWIASRDEAIAVFPSYPRIQTGLAFLSSTYFNKD
jgi:hypothetical protein